MSLAMAVKWIVCVLDLAGAVAILCLMFETTQRASISGVIRGDIQSRWAMTRRVIYSLVAIALFAKSVYLVEGQIVLTPMDGIIWVTVLFALIVFPALRALHVIDQDHWVGFHHRNKDSA